MNERFIPIGDKVLVQPAEAETTTSGGIVLPDSAQKQLAKGTVLAVGPGRTTRDGELVVPQVKAGDVVYYGDFAATQITINAEPLAVIVDNDILGTVVTVGAGN